MNIKDILSLSNVIDVRAADKMKVLQELCRRASTAVALPVETVTREVLKREELGSTGVGEGIAIPHARLANLAQPFGILARLQHPIDFDAVDGRPVDLVFFLLLPEAHAGEQLNVLACVARKLRDPVAVSAMRAATDATGLYRGMVEDRSIDPNDPDPEELAKDMNGRARVDIKDPSGAVTLKAGQLLDGFAQLRDDGTTESGCWIFSGSYTEKGNQMARRDASDPREQGIAPNWAWAWPANRRILYNRASADVAGNPWNPAKPVIQWNGSKWVGIDVPDYGPTIKPSDSVGPFIMNAEGVGRLFARDQMVEGPFPEHYEPLESPVPNVLHPKVRSNPAARVFANDRAMFGLVPEFPYVATTYRLTEHFHFWTKHALINAILQPEEFVEIGEVLAKEKGIAQGGWVRVSSKRGFVVCKAYVTKRIRPLTVDGNPTHIIGVPIHWGFTGQARKGYGANTLTPSVGDANTQTPEFKAFLVNVESASAPVA
jgi:anaerobic selenocysteine-containing dehydrogenase